MSLGQMSVEVTLVLRNASTKVALDGEGTAHARGRSLDEVITRGHVRMSSRVGLGLNCNLNYWALLFRFLGSQITEMLNIDRLLHTFDLDTIF